MALPLFLFPAVTELPWSSHGCEGPVLPVVDPLSPLEASRVFGFSALSLEAYTLLQPNGLMYLVATT